MSKGKHVSKKEMQKIINLAAEGHPTYEIATLTRRSTDAIKRTVRLNADEVAARRRLWEQKMADKFEKITEMAAAGVTEAKIEKTNAYQSMLIAAIAAEKRMLVLSPIALEGKKETAPNLTLIQVKNEETALQSELKAIKEQITLMLSRQSNKKDDKIIEVVDDNIQC